MNTAHRIIEDVSVILAGFIIGALVMRHIMLKAYRAAFSTGYMTGAIEGSEAAIDALIMADAIKRQREDAQQN